MFLVREIRSVVDGDLVAGCDRFRQHQDRLAHRCRTVVAVRIPCEDGICLFARLVVRVDSELSRDPFTVHQYGVVVALAVANHILRFALTSLLQRFDRVDGHPLILITGF